MKNLSKTIAVVAGLTALTMAPVFADSPGQIEGGAIYQIKNVTQNVGFTNPASANKCDVVKYSVRLSNTGFDGLNNLTVTATLPATSGTSNTSTITTSSADAVPTTTTASATLNLTSTQTLSYVNGTTVLYNASGGVIQTLPDGITQNGVNVGSLAGSTTEFVDFQAKVNCPVVPTPPVTPPVTTVSTPPAKLPSTGAETSLAGMLGTGAIGYAVSAYHRSKRSLVDAVRGNHTK